MFKSVPLLLLMLAVASAVKAQQPVHVHGLATLNLIMIDNTLQLEFISPADSIIGFEHEPDSAGEKQAVQSALNRLAQANHLLRIPDRANCRLLDVETGRDSDHQRDNRDDGPNTSGHDHDENNEASNHTEFHVRYHFECNGPTIPEIELTVFENWPRIHRIRYQALTPTGQTGGNITANNRIIRLP